MQSRLTLPHASGVPDTSSDHPIKRVEEAALTRQVREFKKQFGLSAFVSIVALVASLAAVGTTVVAPIAGQSRTNGETAAALKAVQDSQKVVSDGLNGMQAQLSGLRDDLRHAQEEAKRSTDDLRAMRSSWEAQMTDLRVRIDSVSLDIGNVKTKLAAVEVRQERTAAPNRQ